MPKGSKTDYTQAEKYSAIIQNERPPNTTRSLSLVLLIISKSFISHSPQLKNPMVIFLLFTHDKTSLVYLMDYLFMCLLTFYSQISFFYYLFPLVGRQKHYLAMN